MTLQETVVPTKYWHTLEDGRVQCDVCPRFCRMNEGQRGLCFVRMRQDNSVVLTTYGRSSGYCVDPIEKKPLNHFLPGTPILSFGTAGCNLSCKFCQNWDMSKSREMDTLADQAAPHTIAVAAKQLGCSSVAFTYNDPTIFIEYAMDVAQACHEEGIKTVAVTAGYICPEPRAEFYRYVDAANVDLKAFTEDFYHKITASQLQPVLDTLVYLHDETDVWVELTTLLIP
ncbi:MAG TPA: AmmeMemoRadiSam system radical SAM enzyme, partial [Blastocatellia bacterium]|nr:AmmeMemoRadiSam system radical SAM enzyme [Blastocatellia bacterium]